jgi:isopentenyldiphosphate isomerase
VDAVKHADDPKELFYVVDDDDNILGSATREACHRKGLVHRSIQVLVLDSRNKVLVQKRSVGKDLDAGKWDIGIGGHVKYGESSDESALRELLEEAGIVEDLTYVCTIKHRTKKDKENMKVFYCKTDKQIAPNEQEVSEWKFVPLQQLGGMLKEKEFTAWAPKNYATVVDLFCSKLKYLKSERKRKRRGRK